MSGDRKGWTQLWRSDSCAAFFWKHHLNQKQMET